MCSCLAGGFYLTHRDEVALTCERVDVIVVDNSGVLARLFDSFAANERYHLANKKGLELF